MNVFSRLDSPYQAGQILQNIFFIIPLINGKLNKYIFFIYSILTHQMMTH